LFGFEKTKKPLRVFGDWSEFKSSTGKTYFYNCKTEVSQWEKPKGWPNDEYVNHNSKTKRNTIHSFLFLLVHHLGQLKKVRRLSN